MARRFKSEWRREAERFALSNWMYTKWRYMSVEHAPIEDIAEAAMARLRSRINFAYSHLTHHPRSRKAVEQIKQHATELGSIGLWLLERE